MEAVEMKSHCDRLLATLRTRVPAAIQDFRRLLCVMALATCSLRDVDIGMFWKAIGESRSGMLPSLYKHIHEIVWHNRFQNCGLLYVPSHLEADEQWWLVHPRCQCRAMLTKPAPPGIRLARVVQRPCTCLLRICACPHKTMVSHEPQTARYSSMRVKRKGDVA